ncbi:MAG: CCA tRNA nucleotidyltransferase [Holosporaceae bacterium]|jgi:tRNA nucleotidyltransferase/poly(A) polymerase|nr:CCA tRNA nucleotidyltransferase [Holosporaceae bacterium]
MALKKKINNLLTEDVLFLLEHIEKNGYEARLVGGAVRNCLMDVEPTDIDIAITATPTETTRIFGNVHGIKVVPTGIDYGTVTVVRNWKSYEITSLRKDVQTFGRKALVQFTNSFEEDSRRRDFTINAIYVDKNGNIFDYHRGIDDISRKNIRFIGCPEERIKEDFLRILRYFRFVVCYGNGVINEEYLALINSLKSNVVILSTERILAELLTMLGNSDSYKIIPDMKPVLDVLFDLACDPLETASQLNIFAKMTAVERLCLLLKFSKRPDLTSKYKFPRIISQMLALNVDNYAGSAIKRKLKTIRKNLRHFLVQYASVLAYRSEAKSVLEIKNTAQQMEDFCRSEYVDFAFRAGDLGSQCFSQPELKELMMAVKNFWLNSENDVGREECLRFALKHLETTAS